MVVIAESAMQLSICRNARYASIALSQNQNEHIACTHRTNNGESIMAREEQEEWKPLSFDEACERVRQTRINKEMTYEERLKMLKLRYGV